MAFTLPVYRSPDFTQPLFQNAPLVEFKPAPADGVAPDNYHATSVFPEYFQVEKGKWILAEDARMDGVVVQETDGELIVREFRNLEAGDPVVCGREENGEDGIYVHTEAFEFPSHVSEKFAFRSQLSRETSFSIDYDELYELLSYEHQNGFIVWVMGPAVVFDHDTREAFVTLIKNGYVHALLAGNALATHDLEGALFRTALGQELYSKNTVRLGHYKHLDTLNKIREIGSIEKAVKAEMVQNGIMRSVIQHRIPYVLAGSIRDDGPMPEVTADVYAAQDQMRMITRQATTVIALATQLHGIATGNMIPSHKMMPDGTVRPVFFYTVDMSEFAVNKLANRGSLTARSILTNVQDFVVTVERGLRKKYIC